MTTPGTTAEATRATPPGPPIIDLRSDTVTVPPPAMRAAISAADVGDDVYGEDPTVNRLEALTAARFGMEAAVFTASGTMANLLAVLTHCQRGDKILVGDRSDLWLWEAGGGSALGGLVFQPIATRDGGMLKAADLVGSLWARHDFQCAPPVLICLENTHCLSGGEPLPLDYLASVRSIASEAGLRVHLDGARVFNAAVAQRVEVRTIASHVDSVSFCLSKGLAAPVGSMLVGRADFVQRARRLRKMIGGGMRQAGFLAAAGIYALENMVERLKDDHEHARRLATGLTSIPGVLVDNPSPATNIVFWRLREGADATARIMMALQRRGVLVLELDVGRIRAVTHCGITCDDIDRAVEVIGATVANR